MRSRRSPISRWSARWPGTMIAAKLTAEAMMAMSSGLMPDSVAEGDDATGRLCCFGAPKIGKSTLLGQAVGAAVTGRGFLGESAACGQIAIVTEEPIRLAAARLHKYGIPEEHRDAVFLVRVGTPGIEAALQRIHPALIVFDSLAAWLAAGGVQRFSDAGEIRAAFNALRGYADAGAAVLAVHHSRKSDDGYADSRAAGAAGPARGDLAARAPSPPAVRGCDRPDGHAGHLEPFGGPVARVARDNLAVPRGHDRLLPPEAGERLGDDGDRRLGQMPRIGRVGPQARVRPDLNPKGSSRPRAHHTAILS